MGILNGPRINFWGGIQTNVATTNNSDQIGGQDPIDVATSMVSPDITDEALIKLIRTPTSNNYYTDGGWNFYGDHQVHFVSAAVSSEGPAGGVTESGDLVGQPVYLLGSIDPVTKQGPFFGPVMVDLDPTSSQTTQIFIGGLLIGSQAQPKLLIRHDTVGSSQSLALRVLKGCPDAPGSSVANGTFQVTFPKASVTQYDHSSSTIAAIMNDPKATGFVLRFSMFEMAPYLTTPELVAAYSGNTNPSNPSSGRVIGTLGPKYDGEPETCPPGRILVNSVGGATGYAIVDSAASRLSIDAISLMLKQAFRTDRKAFTAPIGPNIDYGPIAICTGSPATPTGASFDAQPADYYKYGGIIDVGLTATQLASVQASPLTLQGSQGGNSVSITEQALRIYSNARNIYIDDLPGQQAVIACVVSYLGGALNADTSFTIASSTPGELPDPDFLSFPDSVPAKAGQSQISFSIGDNGKGHYGFQCLTISAGTASYFVNFRKYLQTDFGIPSGATVTWQQAYENTLRFHYVIFPAMSMRIPLNDMGTIQATGDQIRARISGPYRPTTLLMPITRSLSPSQVALLDCYLAGTPWQPLA
jgi:hypothetical protein